ETVLALLKRRERQSDLQEGRREAALKRVSRVLRERRRLSYAGESPFPLGMILSSGPLFMHDPIYELRELVSVAKHASDESRYQPVGFFDRAFVPVSDATLWITRPVPEKDAGLLVIHLDVFGNVILFDETICGEHVAHLRQAQPRPTPSWWGAPLRCAR